MLKDKISTKALISLFRNQNVALFLLVERVIFYISVGKTVKSSTISNELLCSCFSGFSSSSKTLKTVHVAWLASCWF